jgi:SAM-dependent methyltransferase
VTDGPVQEESARGGVTEIPGSKPVLEEIRSYWNTDARTYDNSRGHSPKSPAVLAAWAAAMARVLPAVPACVLDVGAGTGFLSLIAARLGHKVTALDLSPQMLDRLDAQANREGLNIEILIGAADRPPEGFDAVIERHVLWTLPDPSSALASWRRAAPDGRLVLVESLWGQADPFEALRSRALHALRKMRGDPPDHHSSYSDAVRSALPLSGGTPPSRLVELAAAEGWRSPRLERLRDVEWAERCELPIVERVIGVSPRFVVIAG